MKNTPGNLEVLHTMAAACEGTRYEIHIDRYGEGDNAYLYARIYTRQNAPKYTPEIYIDMDYYGDETMVLRVQTTSYGSLPPSEITQVAEGLMNAATLVNTLALIAATNGVRVKL